MEKNEKSGTGAPCARQDTAAQPDKPAPQEKAGRPARPAPAPAPFAKAPAAGGAARAAVPARAGRGGLRTVTFCGGIKPIKCVPARAGRGGLRTLCICGMTTALAVVLDFCKLILTPTLQVSFSFLANAVCGWACGPLAAAAGCIVADLLSFFLRPDGPFNPVWTAVAFVPGVLYGLVLYRRPVTLLRTALAKALCTLVVNLGLNPLCMAWLYGAGSYGYYLTARLAKNLLLLPVEILLMYALLRALARVLPAQRR